MLGQPLTTTALAGTFLGAGLVLLPASANEPNNSNKANIDTSHSTTVQDLTPFTQLDYVGASFDVSTLRFEKLRMVRVPSKLRYTADSNCQEVGYREPGGSSECTQARTGSTVEAYEVTYSYVGQPLASDEYGNQRFTLHVYFRPDELDASARRAASARWQHRAETAAYFAVRTYREPVQREVIDAGQSTFCESSLVDGSWAHSDANCADKISYKNISVPSDYITVRIEPIALKRGQVGAALSNPKLWNK